MISDKEKIAHKQIILNYCFGHPNFTLLLFPYSSNVVYINHHSTDYNAKLQWTNDFDFYHNKEWLEKSVDFLEDQSVCVTGPHPILNTPPVVSVTGCPVHENSSRTCICIVES